MSDIREMEVKWNGVTEYQTTGQEKGNGKLVASFIDPFSCLDIQNKVFQIRWVSLNAVWHIRSYRVHWHSYYILIVSPPILFWIADHSDTVCYRHLDSITVTVSPTSNLLRLSVVDQCRPPLWDPAETMKCVGHSAREERRNKVKKLLTETKTVAECCHLITCGGSNAS